MIFLRYGTLRCVGYDKDLVPIIDVNNPNHLRQYRNIRYWIDWQTMICQEVWSVQFSDHIRHHSRVIENWTPKYTEVTSGTR